MITTYDFATLYTKIPHDKLIHVIREIIDFVFKGGTRDVISINSSGIADWSSKRMGSCYFFTKAKIIEAVEYLINNCYFITGNKLFKQTIGIPMGSDPAPFLANLFLFYYENRWLTEQRKAKNVVTRKFGNTFRFIDDLLAINDGGAFEQYFRDIYPEELELKKENSTNDIATFLDMDIRIVDGRFVTKLYDKRDNFGFNITKMPYKESKIPANMFYSFVCLGTQLH